MMTLTDDMRRYLGATWLDAHLHDAISGFRAKFGLNAEQTATLLAQWVRETL